MSKNTWLVSEATLFNFQILIFLQETTYSNLESFYIEGDEKVLTDEVSNGEGDESDCKEPCQNLIHSLGHPKARFFLLYKFKIYSQPCHLN